MISVAQLNVIVPFCTRPAEWIPELNAAMDRYGISADIDFVRAFIAQIAVESAELNTTVENLNYSAAGLLLTWPNRFTPETAMRYARRPEAIANLVYANRLGNGDEASGDGWKNRGHGLIQCTGATNINRALTELGLPTGDPSPLRTPKYAALSAAAYWARKPQLNALADDLPHDDDVADFFSITRLVNGALIGIERRKMYWARTKVAIN